MFARILCIMYINPGQQTVFKQSMQWLVQARTLNDNWNLWNSTQCSVLAVLHYLTLLSVTKQLDETEWSGFLDGSCFDEDSMIFVGFRTYCPCFIHLNGHCLIHDGTWCWATRQLLVAHSGQQKIRAVDSLSLSEKLRFSFLIFYTSLWKQRRVTTWEFSVNILSPQIFTFKSQVFFKAEVAYSVLFLLRHSVCQDSQYFKLIDI